jgi:hypothetical protein
MPHTDARDFNGRPLLAGLTTFQFRFAVHVLLRDVFKRSADQIPDSRAAGSGVSDRYAGTPRCYSHVQAGIDHSQVTDPSRALRCVTTSFPHTNLGLNPEKNAFQF